MFKDGVTKERAAWLLADLARVDIVEPVEAADIHEFDPSRGLPAWHIPIKGRVAWSEMPNRMLEKRAVGDGLEDALGFPRGSLRRGVWPEEQVVRIGYVIHDRDKFERGRLSDYTTGQPSPTDAETVVRCLEAPGVAPLDWGFEIVAIEEG